MGEFAAGACKAGGWQARGCQADLEEVCLAAIELDAEVCFRRGRPGAGKQLKMR